MDHMCLAAPLQYIPAMPSGQASVTVIVATYERADWLAVAIRSIQVSAAFANLRGITTRILVVDDGSPSSATKVVAATLGVDYLRNEENDGRNDPSVARLIGLSAVESACYAFFDDDDVMLPRWIAVHKEALDSGSDIAYSAYWVTDSELTPTRRIVPYEMHLGDMLSNHNPINDHCLVATEVARDVWNPDLEKAMMFGGWLELAYRGARFARITEPTYLYRRHGQNMSDQVDGRFIDAREDLVRGYRARVLARDGHIPRPSARLTVRRQFAPIARTLLRAIRSVGSLRA